MGDSRRRKYPKSEFKAGDVIEFYSTEYGGVWKSGVVERVFQTNGTYKKPLKHRRGSRSIRIHVGNGVYITRPEKRCRMASTQLPIDVVPGSHPPRFVWQQPVEGPDGATRMMQFDGNLPVNIERAVLKLITVTKETMRDNAMLRGQVDSLLVKEEAGGKEKPSAPVQAPVRQTNPKNKG